MNTYHDEPDDIDDITAEHGRPRMRADQIRWPLTLEEANASCALAQSKIETMEARFAHSPEITVAARFALDKWRERLLELQWAREQIVAGEAPLSDAQAIIDKLRSTVTKQRAVLADLNRALERKNAERAPPPVQSPEKSAKTYREALHNLAAMALEAFDSMTADGARHTPLSRTVAYKLKHGLPEGHRTHWKVTQREHLDHAVEALGNLPDDE